MKTSPEERAIELRRWPPADRGSPTSNGCLSSTLLGMLRSRRTLWPRMLAGSMVYALVARNWSPRSNFSRPRAAAAIARVRRECQRTVNWVEREVAADREPGTSYDWGVWQADFDIMGM